MLSLLLVTSSFAGSDPGYLVLAYDAWGQRSCTAVPFGWVDRRTRAVHHEVTFRGGRAGGARGMVTVSADVEVERGQPVMWGGPTISVLAGDGAILAEYLPSTPSPLWALTEDGQIGLMTSGNGVELRVDTATGKMECVDPATCLEVDVKVTAWVSAERPEYGECFPDTPIPPWGPSTGR